MCIYPPIFTEQAFFLYSSAVTDIRRIIDVGLATTEGVAVDWVGGNIYWVESNLDQIEVAKLDGTNRTTLLAGNMQSPRAIVLDPRVGYVVGVGYWAMIPWLGSGIGGDPRMGHVGGVGYWAVIPKWGMWLGLGIGL